MPLMVAQWVQGSQAGTLARPSSSSTESHHAQRTRG